MKRRASITAVLTAALALSCVACAPPESSTTLSFRLWDPNVAAAYRTSFDAFEAKTGHRVDIVVIPWEDYWSQLRTDIASGTIDDVFWTNATNLAEYARAGTLSAVSPAQIADQSRDWAPSVVSQFTLDGELWGVPQLTDPGIGVLVNTDLLRSSGLSMDDVSDLSWDPKAPDDTLRTAARLLTQDADGDHPGDPEFEQSRIVHYGYGASSDLNAMLLPFLGSNGGAWQRGDEFVFASPKGVEAIGYLVGLINDETVAPPAADTVAPAGSDAVKDLFLKGRLALFQTGAYSLPSVEEFADFSWAIAPIPSGPEGRISPTNGIVASASSVTSNPDAQAALLHWLGSTEGTQAIGESGSTLPAVLSAQEQYREVWMRRGIDVTPLFDVLENGSVQPPQGQNYGAASDAMRPFLDKAFLGAQAVEDNVHRAQRSANEAMATEP
ncbi:extracellular solute-binding protein [Microbacterium sp. MAHUQ-60]|uniref:extracellular solute-binding protein n=1 Tax=unclassified Microbacterium TaxID=2609290 RepID=UPI003610895F